MVSRQVGQILTASPGYRALPAARSREVADDTVRVALYLVNPHKLLAQEFRNPLLARVVLSDIATRTITFAANSVGMDSEALDKLIAEVDFPKFVSGLIEGVFNAIVQSSIQQMEAYEKLIAAASKSVVEAQIL